MNIIRLILSFYLILINEYFINTYIKSAWIIGNTSLKANIRIIKLRFPIPLFSFLPAWIHPYFKISFSYYSEVVDLDVEKQEF